jgi:DNA-directed RNA polymerase subunit RPC12/RpoP
MLIACTNKGCLQSTEAKLDKGTNEVICMSCGKPIINLTEQMRRTLLAFGQIMRSAERKPFQAHCPTCGTQRNISLVGDVAHCATCGTELRMSVTFLNAFKQHVAQLEKEKKENQ